MSVSELEKKRGDAEEILNILKKYKQAEMDMYDGEGNIELDGVDFIFDEDKKITRVDVPL